MFLHLSVSHSVHRGWSTWAGIHGTRYTPGRYIPGTRYIPRQVHPRHQVHPPDQVHPPRTRYPPDQVHALGPGTLPKPGTSPGTRYPPDQVPPWNQVHPPGPDTPPCRRLLLRTVRILLECILVFFLC